jgi:LysM repeat protein
MTAVDPEVRTPPVPDDPMVDRPATQICPYLAAADGTWRSSTVAREHRCGAVSPPAVLATEKQRRLCLTPDFAGCATFEAARAARPVVHARPHSLPRPLARTTPMVLDHGRMDISIPAFRTDRSTSQAILIALMGLAFAAILLAKFTGGTSPAGATGPSSSPGATVGASAAAGSPVPSNRASATPAAAPSGSTAPAGSQGPAATPRATKTSSQTYKVKSGDTLVGIAAKFGTTTKAIATLNGLKDASSLKIGQVLKIP